MDISDSLSTNNSVLDETMGSILSASNENETQDAENDPGINIITEESNLTSQNIEVNELQNTTESENLPDTTLDNVESYTETLSEQDINLIIMGKPSTSDESEEIISSSVKDSLLEVASTSHIDEHEELWLGDNTRQLVKVDTDEDFEVIVKSLETAIVATERYDIDTVISSNDEPVMSSVASNLENTLGISIIETDSDSLLEDIPSNLLTSAVPPLPLQGIQGDERVELSGRILASEVERPITQHRNLDNYEEFATISEPKVDSFDEQSSSLFEVMEPEIDIPIENEPSLLELQEATMPTDISEEFQQNIDTTEENITTDVSELDEICEASVDSEFGEKQFIQEQIDNDTLNTNEEFSEEPTGSLINVDEKLSIENSTENKIENTDIFKNENKTPDLEENIMDLQSSQLEDIFEINDANDDVEENIITSTQLEIKLDTNNDDKYVEDCLISPELPTESTSETNEVEDLRSSAINAELNVNVEVDTKLSEIQESEDNVNANDGEQSSMQLNIIQDLQINDESSTDISEKQECVESSDNETIVTEPNVVDEQDNESVSNKSKIDSENISLEEDTNNPEEISDLKIFVEGIYKSKIIESTESDIKYEGDKILLTNEKQKETVSQEEIQKDIMLLEETQKETVPLEETQKETLSSEQLQKELVPLEEIKKVAELPEEIQKEIVQLEEPQKETFSPEVIQKEIVPEEDTQKEIVSLKKTQKETVPLEEVQKELVTAKETQIETFSPEEKQKEIVPVEETQKEIVPLKKKQKAVPVEENQKDIVLSAEPQKETVPLDDTEKEIVLAEETQKEIVPLKKTEKAVSVEEKQKDIVLLAEPQKDLVLLDDTEKEIVPLKKTEKAVPVEDIQKDVVLSKEPQKETVPLDDTQNEIMPLKKTQKEPEEIQKDIMLSEETQEETVPLDDTRKDIMPAEEIQKEIIQLKETHKELLSVPETQKDANTSSSKPMKHSLDSDEKEQSPPKKIKLVREKFQMKRVHTESHQFQKNIETSIEHEKKIIIQEDTISCKAENEIITPEKPTEVDEKTVQIPEKITEAEGKETIQQILEKLEEPLDKSTSENKSPVRAQKLKLQRNYKLPQKSAKPKVITKKVEESVSTSPEKIMIKEIKNASIAQVESVKISSKKDVEKILQPSMSKTDDSTLETKTHVTSVDSNESSIINEDETKSVQSVADIDIDHPIETVSTSEISKSNANMQIIEDVTETAQEILSSTEQQTPESIEEKSMETKTIDNQISLKEIQKAHAGDVSKDVKDCNEEQNETDNKVTDNNQIILQINEEADFTQTESTELKTEESHLTDDEVLVDETGKIDEQIPNIENESAETKNQESDLVESEVEEQKEEPENEILGNQNNPQETPTASIATISQNIEETVEEELSKIEIISEEQETCDVKIIENTTTSAETMDVVDRIVDEKEEEILNIKLSSEKIKEPEISQESKQISSSNTESIVENIIDTEMESIITETKNTIDKKNPDEKIEIEKSLDTQKVEMKIGIEEIGLTTHVEKIIEPVNIVETQESGDVVEAKNIVNTEKRKEKLNKYETLEIKFGTDKTIPEPKNDKLLTIDTQFPLLSSRLQERLERKSKVSPINLPTVSQESVSKKIQQQLIENKFIAGNMTISKQDMFPASTSEFSKKEATAFLVQNPEITFTKEVPSSTTDHLATMESATKIKITKRKLDTSSSEPSAKRSVTKPLSVQIDDLESSSTFIERSHSSGTPGQREQESIPKYVIKTIPKSEGRSSPKITIKPIKPPEEMSHKSRTSEESSHSPKITIKPIVKQDPLKITITKQKADDTHSILKIYQPEDSHEQHIPKLTIKSIPKSDEMQHSPRITIKPVKQSPSTSSMSPKITVKPIPSPSEQVDIIHSPKITVKPVVNPEESYPKVTIKPVLRPEESHKVSQLSPRQMKLKSMTFESSSGVTVEPICGTGNLLSPQKLNPESQTGPLKISVKPFAKIEESLSPKLTIKPITKTCEIVQSEDGTSNPLKLTIKPILKPEETSYQSPKITIKPIVKPDEMQIGEELDKPERIILKIQKTSLPSPKERLKDTKKEPEIKIEAIPHDPEKSQRLDKIKLKLTKEGSHAQIIPSVSTLSSDVSFSLKRSLGLSDSCVLEKRSKTDFSGTEILHTSDISINIVQPNAKPCPKTISEEVTIMKIDKVATGSRAPTTEQHISQSKFKEMLMKIQQKPDITCTPHIDTEPDYSSSSDDVKIVEVIEHDPLKDPLSLNDESNSQDIMIVNEVINTNPFQNIQIISAQQPSNDPNLQTPKKRGRPRKNPLEVKPEIKGEDCVEVRPKRTCRAPPGRTPFAVKERKPRGAGRGRGGSRGRGASKSPQKSPKEIKSPRGKALKEAKALAKIEAARLAQEVVIDEITIEDSTNDTPAATPVPPAEDSPTKPEVKEIDIEPPLQMVEPEVKASPSPIIEELPKQPPPPAVYEEETRMSADNSSRAQTPARQVFTAPLVEGPEESQSSVQSTATTESSKTKKGRLEVCDPDSAVTTVDQIVEYSWANGGPYMLQEQIAQYLGVKSFKRKYPGLTRRPVEMQERDYIREKGLVSESMCDMGLTAVPSSEILDIMYSDFQEKYEEYRKCLRDKQAKEISNRQKAVSLATSQEKNKIDFKERAIRSAANWNCNFNKVRKETRKCCMDLQTFTINYPAGKMKVPHKNPVGHYPVALVPGQYTDFYKSYTTNDLRYLPLNTVRYGPVLPNRRCDAAQSDGSQSDSDSSSGSDSDSSDDSMSTEEETPAAIICKPASVQLTPLITIPKSKIH